MKFALKTPVEFGNIKVTELVMRDPKAKDLRVYDEHEGDQAGMLALVAALSGQALPLVEELDLRDYNKVVGWLRPFLALEPAGGPISSGASSPSGGPPPSSKI